ncbi:MAG: energy-coupling factor transporter transmembrane component T [Betaproteobacteria bacterium]
MATVVSLAALPVLAVAAALAAALALAVAGGLRPLRGALWVIPFGGLLVAALPFATPDGLTRGALLALRLSAAALLMTALRVRLGTPGLLQGLSGLRVPPIFVNLIGFTLRYAEVLAGEAQRMLVARKARGFSVRRRVMDGRAIVTYGQLLGVLLLRSTERSERVFLAMLSRGYRPATPQSRRPPLVVSPSDALLLAGSLAAALAFILWDRSL